MTSNDDKPKRFRVVEGGNEPKPYHHGKLKQLICRTCEEDTGVSTGGPWLQAVGSAWEEDGEVVEFGEPILYCPWCLARGKLTIICGAP